MKLVRCGTLLLLLLFLTSCKPTFSALYKEQNYFGACQQNQKTKVKDINQYQLKMLRDALGNALEGTFKLKAYTAAELKSIMGTEPPSGLKDGAVLVHLSAQLKDTQHSFILSVEDQNGKNKLYEEKKINRLMNLDFLAGKGDSKSKAGISRLENYVRSYLNPSGSECNLKSAKYCNWFVVLKPTAGQKMDRLKLTLTWLLEGGGDLCYVTEDFVLKLPKGKSTAERISNAFGKVPATLKRLRSLSSR